MRSTQGSTVAIFGVLIITGVIIADIIAHPTGTKAASNAVTTFSGQTYSALLGGSIPKASAA